MEEAILREGSQGPRSRLSGRAELALAVAVCDKQTLVVAPSGEGQIPDLESRVKRPLHPLNGH